ncbi:MAG TPA: furin-like repeat-containing protein [Candidatus Binatia bacterium]|nr:furin-like repeat-containing protein [Candidatus Binatia bacterium]
MTAVLALAGLPEPTEAAGCDVAFQDAGGGVCIATFVYTGAPEPITVPAGVTALTVAVSGAQGGTSLEEQVDPFGGAASPGGKGGRETAVIPVTPGEALTVVVGQAGTGGVLAPPGYGGYGGGGHASSRYGGNGGGGSYVFDASGPLVAAGGGGGGGYDYNPIVLGHGDQQAPGGDGSGAAPAGDGVAVPFCCDGTAPYNAGGGAGATPAGPGAGGHPTLPPSYVFGQVDGDPGAGPAIDAMNFGTGGSTHNGCCYYTGWAGGGGGGYFGGGGGGNIEAQLEGGGGGGGAGYVTPAAVTSSAATGVQVGDGEVTVSYYTGACDPSCAACSGPTATECTSCAARFVLVAGACVAATTTTTVSTTTTIPAAACPGATQVPFGSDDDGFLTCDKTRSACEQKVAANVASQLVARLVTCHRQAADAAFKNKPFDEEGCETTARQKFLAKTDTAACSCIDANGLATLAETVIDANGDKVYCDAAGTPLGGEDAGFVPTSKAELQCEDGVNACVPKLVKAYVNCHRKAAMRFLKNQAFDEQACELGPLAGKSAFEMFQACVAKVIARGGCHGCEDTAGILALTEAQIDGANGLVFCEP